MCDRNFDAPNFAVDGHVVRLEGILCRASQHGSRPHVELRTMQWARDCRAVERAFTQRTLPVCTFGLRGAEPSFDAENRHIAHQQD